jgi:hypothetical protein
LMQRPTVLEGILVALAASLLISPLIFMLRLVLGTVLAWNATIVVLAYGYIVYLLAQRGRSAGRITLALLSLLVFVSSLLLELRWPALVLVAVGLIWGVRTCVYSRSLVTALLHGGLCLLSLGAALWAYAYSGSLALAVWSFFLLQAAGVLVPPCLTQQTTDAEGAAGEQQTDSFTLAYQAAQKAFSRW